MMCLYQVWQEHLPSILRHLKIVFVLRWSLEEMVNHILELSTASHHHHVHRTPRMCIAILLCLKLTQFSLHTNFVSEWQVHTVYNIFITLAIDCHACLKHSVDHHVSVTQVTK